MAHTKRYQHAGLTFQAWDTVVRELLERADRTTDPTRKAQLLQRVADIRQEWGEQE